MKTKNILILALFIIVSELAGIIGSFFTTPAIQGWYVTLEKPILNPPNWVFAPVWTTLFLLMGVAGYLVYISIKSYFNFNARFKADHKVFFVHRDALDQLPY